MGGKAQRARFGRCCSRQRSATWRSRADRGCNDRRRDVLSCVFDDRKLCLRERVVRSAIIQIHAARDEAATTNKFLGVVEDLWSEVALQRVLAKFGVGKVFRLTIGASIPSS